MPLKLTREQREVFVMMGKRGGVARALALSAERRSQIGLKGAMTRLHNVKIKADQDRALVAEASVKKTKRPDELVTRLVPKLERIVCEYGYCISKPQ